MTSKVAGRIIMTLETISAAAAGLKGKSLL
jgi:hypothetical protein